MVAALFGFWGLPVTIGNATKCSKIPFSVSAPTTINFVSNLGLPSNSETSVPMSIITIGTPVTQRASRSHFTNFAVASKEAESMRFARKRCTSSLMVVATARAKAMICP